MHTCKFGLKRIFGSIRGRKYHKFKGRCYSLTMPGLELNCAPRIMSTILRKLLSLDPHVEAATDQYIDDIFVNENIMSVAEVNVYLARFGLQIKTPEKFGTARVLDLLLHGHGGGELI